MKKALYKVPNGKLLKVFLEDEGGKITGIKITGDFFMYPEEHIEKLEQALSGALIQEKILTEKINSFLQQTPTKFFGLDTESLVKTILAAQ